MQDYYRDSKMRDGHFHDCKPCFLKKRREYNRTDSRKRAIEKWRQRNQLKHKAHTTVWNALRRGRLDREDCRVCGERAEAHHEDYEKPLDVWWLCPEHHGERHRELGSKGGDAW